MNRIYKNYNKNAKITLHHGDAYDFILTLPDKSVKLVVTSPPYNIGKKYEKKVSINEYLTRHKEIIKQLFRVVKVNGSVCWQIGSYVKNGEVYPLDILFYSIFKEYNFILRNRIIWHYGHGLHTKKKFSGRYETILWFTKSDSYTFNLDSVRIPSKYPGKRHYKGPNKGKLSGNSQGKNPSDVWNIMYQDWNSAFWEIPNVKANHPEKTIQPCQYPIELVERCILALSNRRDIVLDPFMGVGTSLLAGLIHNRRVIGCEKEKIYVEIAKDRLRSYFKGTLKRREFGKPIYNPSKNLKVAQVPKEWIEKKK